MIKELSIPRGDTVNILLVITRNRVAYDLTDYLVLLTVKEKYTDADANAVLSVTGTIDDPPTDGKARISLTSTNMDIAEKTYVYDIKIYKEDDSVVKTILTGNFIVTRVAKLMT